MLLNQISLTPIHCENITDDVRKADFVPYAAFSTYALCKGWEWTGRSPGPWRNKAPTANLCTFSMAATSASAARLKNADTAGISGVLLRVSMASLLCAHASWQPVSVTLGRLLCSSFGLSSAMQEKSIRRGPLCFLQRKLRARQCEMRWRSSLLTFVIHWIVRLL